MQRFPSMDHSSRGLLSITCPVFQRTLIPSTGTPRLRSSARFCSVGTNPQRFGSQVD